MRSFRSVSLVCLAAVALLAVSVPAHAQCSGGSCGVSSFSFQPRFSFVPAAPQYSYAPPAAPQLYELADSTGQAFRHADPAYLQSWIAQRNIAMAMVAAKATTPAACPEKSCALPSKPAAPAPPAFQFGLKAPDVKATSCPCVTANGSCPCAGK